MMTRSLAVLFLLLSLLSCGKSSSHDKNATKSAEHIKEESFSVKIKMINFYKNERPKILKAGELIRQVIISEEFKEEVLNHEFNGERTFANNKGLSNEQIYKKILEASERLTPGIDYEMDLTLVAYLDEESNTIGYTYPSSQKIWMNRKYFSRYDAADVTSNMVHEWLHKLGFEHDSASTPERKYSVPYSVGYIVRRLARRIQFQ